MLEVLVALAVLAISFGVLLPVFSGTLGYRAALADQQTANMLAQSKLAEIGSTIPLIDGKTEGKFANGFTWHVEIAPYQSDRTSTFVFPKLVTLNIGWSANSGPREYVIKTMRLVGRE